MSKETNEFERDLKDYPPYKEEQAYNDREDYNHEIQLEQARNIVEFHLELDNIRKEISNKKIEFDELLSGLLSDYPQTIIDEFLLGE